MKRGIKPGKLVRYTGNFLRWTGNYFPPTNGIVLSVDERTDGSSTGRIVWSDHTDEAVTILLANIEPDPTCKGSSYPDLLREFAEKGIK